MDKSEYRRVRRQWRAEAKARRREERLKAMNWFLDFGGTYNKDLELTDYRYVENRHFQRNNMRVSRVRQKGDFKSTTPYSKEVFTQSGASLLYYQWFYDRGSTHLSGLGAKASTSPTAMWWGAYDDSSSQRSALDQASQKALLAKIRANAPTWDVLTDLAEAKETVGLLRGSAQWLLGVAAAVKRRDVRLIAGMFKVSTSRKGIKRLRRTLYPKTLNAAGISVGSSMSRLWMSYRYGFMPMIYSMQDAMIAFGASWAKGVKLTEQVTLKDEISSTYSNTGSTFSGYKAVNHSDRYCSGSFRKKAYFNYTNSMLSRLGVNPYSLARTAWELVPFSFVIDWFVGIGDFLDNLQVDTITCNSSVNITEKGSTRLVDWWAPDGVDPGYRHTIHKFFGNSVESTYFNFRRSRGNLSAPGVDLSQSWYTFKRSIDSACLLWSRYSRKLNEFVDPSGFTYRVR